MSEWLLTIAVLTFAGPHDAGLIDGFIAVVSSESLCEQAKEMMQRKHHDKRVLMTCTKIEAGAPTSNDRGSST